MTRPTRYAPVRRPDRGATETLFAALAGLCPPVLPLETLLDRIEARP